MSAQSAHLAVIDPGARVPELDCFNRMARRSALSATYHLPALQGVDSLERVADGVCGAVILGSGASVHDGLEWQDALRAWLAPLLERGVPLLGLCYGHQLLAHMLGGRVELLYPDGRKLRGLREVPLDADPLWGAATSGPLLVSHREAVVELGPGCRSLGSSPVCAIEAFRADERPVWGIQAHPEATPAFIANNGIPFEADPAVLTHGHRLVDAFLDLVAASPLDRAIVKKMCWRS